MATNRRSAGSQQHEQHICGFNCSRHQHHGAVTTVRGRRPWCHFLAPKARHGHRPRTVQWPRPLSAAGAPGAIFWLQKRATGAGRGQFYLEYLLTPELPRSGVDLARRSPNANIIKYDEPFNIS